MINHHRTALCPYCNRDSYASEFEAFFATAKCTWCDCEFKYKDGKYVIIKDGKKS